jgi:hypothetical protein
MKPALLPLHVIPGGLGKSQMCANESATQFLTKIRQALATTIGFPAGPDFRAYARFASAHVVYYEHDCHG